MRSSLDYAGFDELCGRSPIMRKIMRAHNCIIPQSLAYAYSMHRPVKRRTGIVNARLMIRITTKLFVALPTRNNLGAYIAF